MRKALAIRCSVAVVSIVAMGMLAGPAAAKTKPPKIKSVTFTGTPAEPTVTVKGTGLGSAPTGEPAPPCFSPTPTGDDYAEGVAKFTEETRGWAAGQEGDCIGLIFSTYTEREVVFTFGSGYDETMEYEPVQQGDSYEVTLHGVSHKGKVKYKK